MRSIKEFRKLNESQSDEAWKSVEAEIDKIFSQIKTAVHDMTMPRRGWVDKVRNWWWNHKYGSEWNPQHPLYTRFTPQTESSRHNLNNYYVISQLIKDFERELNEASTSDGMMYHVEDIIDKYKEKLKNVVKAGFQKAMVSAPTAPKSPVGIVPRFPPPEEISDTEKMRRGWADPHITLPDEIKDEIKAKKMARGMPKAPEAMPEMPKAPEAMPGMPKAPEAMPGMPKAPDGAPLTSTDHELPPEDDEKVEKLMVAIGIMANMVLHQGYSEDEARDAAESMEREITDPEQRALYVKQGHEYLKRREEETEVRKNGHSEYVDTFGKHRSELLQLAGRHLKSLARKELTSEELHQALGGGSNITKKNREKVVDAIIEKRRKNVGLPAPESLGDKVEHYRQLLQKPHRPVILYREAAKLPTIEERIKFYKKNLSSV